MQHRRCHLAAGRAARALAGSFLLSGALMASAASAAPPPGLCGSTGGGGGGVSPAPSGLYRVDSDTGATTSVGPIGYAVTGLALDPATGILYAVTANAAGERFLLTIDLGTGEGTESRRSGATASPTSRSTPRGSCTAGTSPAMTSPKWTRPPVR